MYVMLPGLGPENQLNAIPRTPHYSIRVLCAIWGQPSYSATGYTKKTRRATIARRAGNKPQNSERQETLRKVISGRP